MFSKSFVCSRLKIWAHRSANFLTLLHRASGKPSFAQIHLKLLPPNCLERNSSRPLTTTRVFTFPRASTQKESNHQIEWDKTVCFSRKCAQRCDGRAKSAASDEKLPRWSLPSSSRRREFFSYCPRMAISARSTPTHLILDMSKKAARDIT